MKFSMCYRNLESAATSQSYETALTSSMTQGALKAEKLESPVVENHIIDESQPLLPSLPIISVTECDKTQSSKQQSSRVSSPTLPAVQRLLKHRRKVPRENTLSVAETFSDSSDCETSEYERVSCNRLIESQTSVCESLPSSPPEPMIFTETPIFESEIDEESSISSVDVTHSKDVFTNLKRARDDKIAILKKKR